jgi:oxidase EvaA
VECGNLDILEIAPTVQCLTGNYRDTKKGRLPFLEYVLNAKPHQIKFDTFQSEEGGRFFQEQNRNLIIEADDDFDKEVPGNYIWMTLVQLKLFLKFNNYLNIQARSLISAIDFL